MTHREMDADEIESGVSAVYEHVRESFELAMAAEGIPAATRIAILTTVQDAVVNNFDKLLAAFYGDDQSEEEPGMTDMSATWRLLYAMGEDHKLFREISSGRLAIADNSGQYPPDTDDGVLYVDIEEPISMGWSDQDKHILIMLPLRKPDGEEARAGITPELAFFLANSGMQIAVNYHRYQVTRVEA